MVSMMQALQSGASLSVHPGQIVWNTPDRSTLGFTNRHRGELHNIGVLADIDLVQGIAMDDHLELLFVMTEDLFDATKDNMPVATGRRTDPAATGRRTDPAAAYHGYVVWQRRGVPNHPRIEISPDQGITLWYHWPDEDAQPSMPESPLQRPVRRSNALAAAEHDHRFRKDHELIGRIHPPNVADARHDPLQLRNMQSAIGLPLPVI